MAKSIKPSPEEMAEFVRKYDKRIGMRMLYRAYNIPEGERHLYRKLWDEFWNAMPDAYEKETADASEDTETETADGDSHAPAGQAVQEE